MADMTFKAKLLPAVNDSTEYTLGSSTSIWQIAYKNNTTALPSTTSYTGHYIAYYSANGSNTTATSASLNGSALAQFAFFSSGYNSLELGKQGVSTGFIALRHKDNQANIYTQLTPSVVSGMRYIDLPDKSGTVVVSSTTGTTSQFLRGDNEWSYKLEGNEGSTVLGVINTYSTHTSSNIWLYSSSTIGLMWTSTSSYDSTRKKIIALSADRTNVTSEFPLYLTNPVNINCDQDVGQNQNGSLIIGSKTGYNIGIDANEIMARNNGAPSTLSINAEGGDVYTTKLYGAVWNDYAEFRETKEEIEPGRCIREVGDDTLVLTTERLQRGCEIVSDTFGFAIGQSKKCKTPTVASGRVLAYLYEDREEAKKKIGWPVCSGPNGTVSIMTEEEEEKYPSRIIGTISAVPDYETWNSGAEKNPDEIKVNGRVWIRIR